MEDVFDLERFVEAQGPVSDRVMRELEAARKTSHWMWFVFPQIAGLGLSPTSVFYALGSLDEARAYADHPSLGSRLRECAGLVLAAQGRTARQIFGPIDARKFGSSMTLFERARPEQGVFAACLDKYFAGERDAGTLARS